jgi:enoyl-CoA hydratase/carnithine racemase
MPDGENEGVLMTDPPRVSVADLAEGAAGNHPGVTSLDDLGQVTDPLVLVELDGAATPAVVARAAARARDGGRLYVGVGSWPVPESVRPLLAALDVTLVSATGTGRDPSVTVTGPRAAEDAEAHSRACVAVGDAAAEARALAVATARFPQAALVLGQVLRASESLPVFAALDVESFAYSMLLGGTEFRRWLDGRGERRPPALVAEPVLTRRDGDRLLVTLNRPERRNAYGRQLRDALTDALRVAVLDPDVRRVVLDGAGPAFCSGGDLAEFGTAPDLVTAHFVRTLGGAGRLVSELKDRTEVHVHGPCVGAGVEIPAFAGTVIADEGTTFTLPEVSMGLVPGAGGTVSIPRRIGRWRTLHLALTGRPLDARTALSWTLIDRIQPSTPMNSPSDRGRRPSPAARPDPLTPGRSLPVTPG